MHTNRANQILNQTKENIEVLHNGNQVWIENVDSRNQTATVRDLTNNQTMSVPVNELNETGMQMR